MRTVYLDNAATTPVCPEALAAFSRAAETVFANPSSLHAAGFAAERLVAESRAALAEALGGRPDEVVFTPGGTFGDNLAVLGGARKNARAGRHIVTTQIEHDAVLNAAAALEREGFAVTRVAPGPDGRVSAADVLAAVRPDTALVSVMLLNNEVGTLQPVSEIARGLRRLRSRAVFHTDAVQAFGRVPFSIASLGADLVTVSGHKLHAPKGIGALWIRKGVRLAPLTFGGGQERDLVPGTEPVPLIAAFAAAAAARDRTGRAAALKALALERLAAVPGLAVLSPGDASTCMVSLPGFRSETLLHYLSDRGISVSSGSACGRGKPSHVLKAMGLSPALRDGALRISFSSFNTEEDVRLLTGALTAAVSELAHV